MTVSRSDRYTFTQTRKDIFASDFAPDFMPHPDTGDLLRVTNAQAIKQSLRNLILTQPLKRPFQARAGSGLMHMLFEPATEDTAATMRTIIFEIVELLEPRVKLVEVKVVYLEEQNGYQVSLLFQMINNTELATLDVILYRVR